MSEALRLAREAQEVFKAAEAKSRPLSSEERNYVEDLLTRAGDAKNLEVKMHKLGQQLGPPEDAFPGGADVQPGSFGDPGRQFIESQQFKQLQSSDVRGQTWTTGAVETKTAGGPLAMKGTLLEGAGAPGSGTGGGLIPIPTVAPGVVSQLYQPVYLETLLSTAQATTNTVRYVTQATSTSGAAGVAEGGLKPESTLEYDTVDEPVKKVATSIVTSDELIEDAPAVQQLINGDLSLFVNIEVERQLLRGTSGGNEVQGLLTSRSVPVYTAGTAQGNIAEQMFKAMNSMRGSAYLEPDWVVMSPADYQSLRLLKDTSGQLYFGGPNTGTYGQGQAAAASPQITGAPDVVWGKPCYVTQTIGSGTALVGTRLGAAVWNRGGLSVESTNSHASHFTSNLMATRAERRLALAVYRPKGYVEVRGLA